MLQSVSRLLTATNTNAHPQLREDRVWTVTAFSLQQLMEEEQLGTISLLSWPYALRAVQVCAAKLGRRGVGRRGAPVGAAAADV